MQVLGIDVLGGCKVYAHQCLCDFYLLVPCGSDCADGPQEVEKQFSLVERHILQLRKKRVLEGSEIVIMCERNLGFESEHMQRALNGIPNVRHRIDHAAQRYGIIMNEEV